MWLPWQWAVVLAATLASVSLVARRRGKGFGLLADFTTQAALVAGLYSVWQLITSYADRRVVGAEQHGIWVWRLERDLHLPSEASLQHFILHHPLVVEACNIFYAQVHAPALGVFLVWLFVRHRADFAHYRNMLAVLTLLCLLAYLVPVAPPRLLPNLGMVDTGLLYHQSEYGKLGTGIADQLSAMPSVHMAWALLIAVAVVSVSRSRWRWLAVAHPVVTMLVVVLTANHYWLDGAGAAILLAVAVVPAAGIDRVRVQDLFRRLDPRVRPAAPSPLALTVEGSEVRQDA